MHLVFQDDGASRAPAMEYAGTLGLQRCEWKGCMPEADLLPALLQARMLVVTQRPETRGPLRPSKLALLERLPHSVLYVSGWEPDHISSLPTHTGKCQRLNNWLFECGNLTPDSRLLHGWV